MGKLQLNKCWPEDCITTMTTHMPANCIDLVITSPPYFGCRVYGNETLGREESPRDYITHLVDVAQHVKRVLKPGGTFYLNVGDVYFGSKGFSRNAGTWARKTDHHYKEHKICKPDGKYIQHKQLLLLPSRIAIAMQDDGWILRNDIIWEKTNPLPASARDRRLPCYEHVFHFVKSRKYFYSENTAKKISSNRDVFRTGLKPFGKHPAAFTAALIEPLVLTSSRKGGIVYDPFMGSGTTAVVASVHKRKWIGSEINEEYVKLVYENVKGKTPPPETIDVDVEVENIELEAVDESVAEELTMSGSSVSQNTQPEPHVAELYQKIAGNSYE